MGTNRTRIFIVEDEIVIVRGLEDTLERLGHAACGFAFSGEEALALIKKQRPDLVLVDIYLRGEMDGIELAQRITSVHGIPVIYITAYSDREVLERAKITDTSGYLVKPIRARQLKVNIELAIERHRREREKAAALESYRATIDELRHELHEKGRRLREAGQALSTTRRELDGKTAKLEELRQELQEVSNSLLNLTAHMARTKEEMEMEVAAAVRTRILPFLRHLQCEPALGQYRIELEMLTMHMGHLASNLRNDANVVRSLSTTELRVAALIKNNLTTDQIAGQLFISPETVKTHRRSIRRKLGLRSSNQNLSSYLKAQWAVGH